MRLENKVAVVTGAQRGIGRAISEAFAREGAKVVVSDIAELEDIESTVRDINSKVGREATLAIHVDVTKAEDVDRGSKGYLG